MASLSFMIQVKLRGVMPSAHLPRRRGGISGRSRGTSGGNVTGWYEELEPLAGTSYPNSATQVARLGPPGGDVEHPLDGSSSGSVAGRVLRRDPAPHRPPGEG